jgi:hypothetical protein
MTLLSKLIIATSINNILAGAPDPPYPLDRAFPTTCSDAKYTYQNVCCDAPPSTPFEITPKGQCGRVNVIMMNDAKTQVDQEIIEAINTSHEKMKEILMLFGDNITAIETTPGAILQSEDNQAYLLGKWMFDNPPSDGMLIETYAETVIYDFYVTKLTEAGFPEENAKGVASSQPTDHMSMGLAILLPNFFGWFLAGQPNLTEPESSRRLEQVAGSVKSPGLPTMLKGKFKKLPRVANGKNSFDRDYALNNPCECSSPQTGCLVLDPNDDTKSYDVSERCGCDDFTDSGAICYTLGKCTDDLISHGTVLESGYFSGVMYTNTDSFCGAPLSEKPFSMTDYQSDLNVNFLASSFEGGLHLAANYANDYALSQSISQPMVIALSFGPLLKEKYVYLYFNEQIKGGKEMYHQKMERFVNASSTVYKGFEVELSC